MRHIIAAIMLQFAVSDMPLCAATASKDYVKIVRLTQGMSTKKVIDMGDREKKKKHADDALVFYMVACNRLKDGMSDEERQQCGIAHLKAGNVYYDLGRYADALDYYVNGLKIYEQCKNQKEIGRFYNNIGSIYCTFQEFEKGLGYYAKGLECCRKYHDRKNEYKLLVNMAGVNAMIGKTKEARKQYAESERLRDKNDKVKIFMSGYNFALILIAESNYKKAIHILKKQATYSEVQKIAPEYTCSAYQQIYRAYMQMRMKDSAMAYMDKTMQIVGRHGIVYKFVDILKDYSDIYESKGDLAKAQSYLSRYVKLKDSIYNMREFDIAKNAQFLYEVGKTEKEISAYHEKEKDHRRTINAQRILMLGISCVIIIIGLFLLVVMRQKRKIDKSYNDLFSVNRNFVETIEQMKGRIRSLNAKLEEADEVRKHAESRYMPNPGEAKDETEAEATQKYQSSNLNESRQSALAEAITGIMENTEEFCSPDFSLDRLASLVGSNSKYVSQSINDTFNKNFSNFVNEYRIRKACVRLADTRRYGNYTIKAIAEGVGFRSQSAFISVFKRITGITPSMFQDKAKANTKN